MLRSATADCGGGSGWARTAPTVGAGEDSGTLALRPIEPVVAGSRGVGACAVWNGLLKGASLKRIVSDEQALTLKASAQAVDRRKATLDLKDPVWLRID
ncbi:hypothetical protein [Bosea sp. (in: a-proteobacteria)]|uniref:hypothetical protein n=1 Tax=Bosea sp. (in: a-proteobacteria) TaxID=1871050 RepID=UPI003F70E381